MNKQEALKRIEAQKETLIRLTGWAVYVYIEELIKSLDEPEKITIPQFVADWIEKCKNSLIFSLKSAMNINTIMHYSEDYHKLIDWIKVNSNQETFCHAWIFGYEVEEEKRYLVKMKRIDGYGRYLNKALLSEEYFFASDNEISGYITKHTRKQLEDAGFGWVFDCEGIEIEEVE